MRYVLKYERNLISLCRLEASGCSLKAISGSLKVIRGSIMRMKGRKSESTLYILQVRGGCLGYNIDDNVYYSPRRLHLLMMGDLALRGDC